MLVRNVSKQLQHKIIDVSNTEDTLHLFQVSFYYLLPSLDA